MSRLRARTWQRRPVSLTPLIDIIFLLLLFFMLSSTFTRFAELPLQNAGGGAGAGATPLFLQLGPETVTLNGEAMALDTLPAALAPLEAEAEGADGVLLVTLSGEVTSQRLVDLLVALRAAPWLTVSVLG